MKISRKTFLNSFKSFWPFELAILLIVIFFWKFFVKNQIPIPADLLVSTYYPWSDNFWGVAAYNPITSDSISFIYPMRTLAVNLIKSGQLPLWNPYLFTGAPLLANFQSASYSPTNLVYLFFDNYNGWALQVILQHLLGFVFTYLLLRHWKLSKFASTFGGLVFAFSGFSLLWSVWNSHTLTTAFIPLVVLFADRWLEKNKARDGLGISISLALQIFSGYPQIVFYTFIALGSLLLIKTWKKQIFVKIFKLSLFILLGFAISSVQLLPGLELLNLSQRSGEFIPIKWAFLTWQEVITFIAPDFFGNHTTMNYWGSKNYLASGGFIGVTCLVLALFTLINLRKKIEVKFLILVGLFSLLLAFPTPVGLLVWKSGLFGAKAGISFRSLSLFAFSISLLSAFGIEELRKNSKKHSLRYALLIPLSTILLFGIVTSYFFYSSNFQDKYFVALKGLVLPFAIFVLLFLTLKLKWLRKIRFVGLLLLVLAELFLFGWKFIPFSSKEYIYPDVPAIEFLNDQKKPFRVTNVGDNVMPVNLGMPYGLEFPGGYDAMYPTKIAKYISVLNSGDAGSNPQDRYAIVSNFSSPMFDLLNTKYILAKSDYEYDQKKFEKIYEDKNTIVLENKDVLPRAFMVYDWDVLNNENDILKKMLSKNFPFDQKIILNKEVDFEKEKTGKSEINYDRDKITVVTDKPGFLFVSDSYYPGWKAYVDKTETEIYEADYAFRAVYVPSGEHVVSFKYYPQSFSNGVLVSLLSVILVVFLGIILQ